MGKKIRILIADDHKLFRMGVISLLEAVDEFMIIGEVENGQELIDKYVELSPDIILVDISMPLINGIEAIRVIKKINKDVKALILSMYDSDIHVYYSMKSGAKGLLSKNTMKGELIHAIKSVYNGSFYFGRSLTEEKMVELEKKYSQSIPLELDDYNQLNSKDRKILEFIGKGMTSQEIADNMKMSKKSIDYYRSSIMRRLGIKDLTELLNYSIRYSTLLSLSSEEPELTGYDFDVSVLDQEYSMKEFGKILRPIIHNMKNYISLISIRCNNILKELDKDESKIKKEIEDVVRSLIFLKDETENIKNLGTYEILSIRNQKIDISTLLDELISLIVTDSKIVINKDYEQNIYFLGEENTLRTLFSNLLSNACQAMPKGGSLTIRISQNNKYLKVVIKDTGIGIPVENYENIFKINFSTKRDGYGIGLFLVQKIVSQYKGTIQFRSVVNDGTTFIIELPIYGETNEKI